MSIHFNKLDPECKEIILEWLDAPSPETGMSIQDLRKGLLLDKELIGEGPSEISTKDIVIENRYSDQIEARIYRKKGKDSEKTLLYLHGGGWVSCSIETHDTFCKYLAHYADINVISINYRLAPEYKYPAALEDTEDVLDWISSKKNTELKTDPKFIGVAGDSAGGNLTAAISLKLRDINKKIISLQVIIYGALSGDMTSSSFKEYGVSPYRLKKETMEWFWLQYIPTTQVDREEYLEPIKANNFTNLPKSLIFTSEHDVLRDEAEEYFTLLKEHKNNAYHKRFGSLPHGFVNMIGKSKKAKESSIFIAEKIKELWT